MIHWAIPEERENQYGVTSCRNRLSFITLSNETETQNIWRCTKMKKNTSKPTLTSHEHMPLVQETDSPFALVLGFVHCEFDIKFTCIYSDPATFFFNSSMSSANSFLLDCQQRTTNSKLNSDLSWLGNVHETDIDSTVITLKYLSFG